MGIPLSLCGASFQNRPRPYARFAGLQKRTGPCGSSRRSASRHRDAVQLIYVALQQFRRHVPRYPVITGPHHDAVAFLNRMGTMLKDKTAVITGSTSGIGLGIARALAGEGASVILNGFGEAGEVEKTRSAIEAEFGVKAAYSPADMTKPGEIAAMIKTAEQTFGAVDILVNNAGIQHVAPVEEFPI